MVQFTGGIILFNKKRKLIYWSLSVLVIIIFCTNINTLLIYTHQVTPVAGKLSTSKQIKKDLAYILRDNYRISSVKLLDLVPATSLYLGQDKEVLLKAYQATDDKYVQISSEDKKMLRWKDVNSQEAKLHATNQAVKFLKYFVNREYDPTIKAVFLFYNASTFSIDDSGETPIAIGIDEFNKEYHRLMSEGYKGEKLEKMLVEKFIY
jgi:hypothetical protein